MADDPVRFSRESYSVTYRDLHGKMQTIRRTPPPKLHDALPTDVVEITNKHSDDFDAGEEAEVAYISPRNPNLLQLKNGHGETAFVEYFDVSLKDEVAPREEGAATDGARPQSRAANNRYLLWP